VGLKDRPYWREGQDAEGAGEFARGFTVGMPRLTKAVKYLLIVNVAVFIAQLVLLAANLDLSRAFGATVWGWWQVWRYVTFQFLHSPNSLLHLGLNMLGLYMLGTPLEQQWGARRFLAFYLSCGAFAGLAYVVMAATLSLPRNIPLVGASGGVYAIVLACAVLFPHFRLIFYLFPVPIRLAAVIIFGGMALVVLGSLSSGQVGPGFWSDVAHLGGAVAGAFWIWGVPRIAGRVYKQRLKFSQGAWQRRLDGRRREQEEMDRILDKIRQEGLNSLTGSERSKLRDATVKQNRQESEYYKS